MSQVPFLDDLDPESLMTFWLKHRQGRCYHELFPEGGKGTRAATSDLANYASNKATAIRCRLAGKIQQAQDYESICERIYNDLPKFAQF